MGSAEVEEREERDELVAEGAVDLDERDGLDAWAEEQRQFRARRRPRRRGPSRP